MAVIQKTLFAKNKNRETLYIAVMLLSFKNLYSYDTTNQPDHRKEKTMLKIKDL